MKLWCSGKMRKAAFLDSGAMRCCPGKPEDLPHTCWLTARQYANLGAHTRGRCTQAWELETFTLQSVSLTPPTLQSLSGGCRLSRGSVRK